MDSKNSKLQHYIRLLKNHAVHQYYQTRIDIPNDPYKILGRSKLDRILFVLSHMRSGSSLLTHILNTNNEIIGYGETHIKYSSELDFKALLSKVYLRFKKVYNAP